MEVFKNIHSLRVLLVLILDTRSHLTQCRLTTNNVLHENVTIYPEMLRPQRHSLAAGFDNLHQLNSSNHCPSGAPMTGQPARDPRGRQLPVRNQYAQETFFQNPNGQEREHSTMETRGAFSGELSVGNTITRHASSPCNESEATVARETKDREELEYSNRTDHCAYYFSDKSCPSPTVDEMSQIDIICWVLEIQIDTIFCVALALGLPGSVLVVVTVTSMATSPSTVYMVLLSLSDFIALFSGLQIFKLPNMGTFTLDDMIPMWFCRVFQAFSHWSLALICLERFVTVQFPLHKSRLYTMKATKASASAAFLISIVPYGAARTTACTIIPGTWCFI